MNTNTAPVSTARSSSPRQERLSRDDYPGLGERIRVARHRKGMTLRQLADVLGVHERTAAGYEAANPRSYPTLERAIKIAEATDVTLSWLLNLEDVAA